MFEIRYKIINYEDTVPEEYEIYGEYGLFELRINENIYGLYIDVGRDIFNVPIYWWFYYLLEALLNLCWCNYVLLSDYDSSTDWLEFKRENEWIHISNVSADKTDFGVVSTKKPPNFVYDSWQDEKLLFVETAREILSKASNYLNEVKKLNNSSHKRIQDFENLLSEVSAIIP